jgi:exopolysaccharide biosynthesis WecB/TagA/CpsF family protein
MMGVLDPEQLFRLNALDLATPDGQPVRWALNLLYRAGLSDRVYGPKLALKVMEACGRDGTPIYLYGATNAILSKLREALAKSIPNLLIAGSEPSRFGSISQQDCREIALRIKDSGAKVTFVGTGCPRQEIWAYEFRNQLSMPVLAVGAAFTFIGGTLPEAPVWMQKHGLEWVFRLLIEPRRLWRRYILLNPLYLALIALQLCGKCYSAQGVPPVAGTIPG